MAPDFVKAHGLGADGNPLWLYFQGAVAVARLDERPLNPAALRLRT